MSFEKLYDALNSEQKRAVDAVYGPLMVIAGPWSGKTQLLAVRIANILRTTDADPANVLCLTFTENAARNMRERLATIIGAAAYRVAIHTFHSFGNEILASYRSRIPDFVDAKPIDDIGACSILDSLLEALPWNDPFKPSEMTAGDRIQEIRRLLGEIKNAGISPDEFDSIMDTNAKILSIFAPFAEPYIQEIYSLGAKKEEKIQKVARFLDFVQDATEVLSRFPARHGFLEGYAPVLARALGEYAEAIASESDTKPITQFKNDWLRKDAKDQFVITDVEKLPKLASLAKLYRSYETKLREAGYVDFSDMILTAISLVEGHPDIRANLAERYQFILVDEYQDTNDAQLRLLTSIVGKTERPNVFAVGDDDQSIYKFQGANSRNLRIFKDLFPDTELVILEKNYRSRAEIVETSRQLMEGAPDVSLIFPGRTKAFEAVRGNGGTVLAHRYANECDELSSVVESVERIVAEGTVPFSEIAIISKKNAQLERLAKLLLEKRIPVSLSKDENLFDTDEFRLLDGLLEIVQDFVKRGDFDQEAFVRLVSHPAFGIHRLKLWEIAKDAYHARSDDTRLWIERFRNHEEPALRNLALFLIELSLRSAHLRLEDLIDFATGANALRIPDDYDDEPDSDLLQIRMPSGEEKDYVSPYYEYFFSRQSLEYEPTKYSRHLANVRKLVEAVRTFRSGKDMLTIGDYSEFMRLVRKYRIRIQTSHLIGSDSACVQCVTAHKSKGLEYSVVFAVGLSEKGYKNGRTNEKLFPAHLPLSPEKDDDEDLRRLAYTVFTRAKDELYLSYSDTDLSESSDGPLPCLSHLGPDRFLPGAAAHAVDAAFFLRTERKDLYALPYLGEESDFLRDRIKKNFTLSATALQNFLNVVDGGPEKFVANNVLRFPQAKSLAACYGTAMHKGLEDFFSDYQRTGGYSKKILLESFRKAFLREGFDEATRKTYIQRGTETLEKLYGEITGKKYGELHLEFDFRTPGVFLDGTQLTGKIDRIEVLPDGTVRVTDYKTGGWFSSFHDSGAAYERIKKWKYRLQLAFYAILFELSPRWQRFERKEYELLFIEPNRKTGEFDRVVEYVQDGEIERTKKLIRAVSDKLEKLDFPDVSGYSRDVDGIRQFEEDLLAGNV